MSSIGTRSTLKFKPSSPPRKNSESIDVIEKKAITGQLVYFTIESGKVSTIINGKSIPSDAVQGLPNTESHIHIAAELNNSDILVQDVDENGSPGYKLEIIPVNQEFFSSNFVDRSDEKSPAKNIVKVYDENGLESDVHLNAQLDVMLEEVGSPNQAEMIHLLIKENEKLNELSKCIETMNRTSDESIKIIANHILFSSGEQHFNIKMFNHMLIELEDNKKIITAHAYSLSKKSDDIDKYIAVFQNINEKFQETLSKIYENHIASQKIQNKGAEIVIGKLLEAYKMQANAAENILMKIFRNLVPIQYGPINETSRINLFIMNIYQARYGHLIEKIQGRTNQSMDFLVEIINKNNIENSIAYINAINSTNDTRKNIDEDISKRIKDIKDFYESKIEIMKQENAKLEEENKELKRIQNETWGKSILKIFKNILRFPTEG